MQAPISALVSLGKPADTSLPFDGLHGRIPHRATPSTLYLIQHHGTTHYMVTDEDGMPVVFGAKDMDMENQLACELQSTGLIERIVQLNKVPVCRSEFIYPEDFASKSYINRIGASIGAGCCVFALVVGIAINSGRNGDLASVQQSVDATRQSTTAVLSDMNGSLAATAMNMNEMEGRLAALERQIAPGHNKYSRSAMPAADLLPPPVSSPQNTNFALPREAPPTSTGLMPIWVKDTLARSTEHYTETFGSMRMAEGDGATVLSVSEDYGQAVRNIFGPRIANIYSDANRLVFVITAKAAN